MMQTIPVLETLARDVRQSARSLRKSPSFTAAVVLTLAVGIRANTAIFSICNAVLLKPLPYAAPQTLVMLWERMGPADRLIQVAPANFRDWRDVFVPYVLGESPSRGAHPSHPIGRRSGAAHLIEVLSADGKSRGTGIVTAPVAAHSVPRWSRTM